MISGQEQSGRGNVVFAPARGFHNWSSEFHLEQIWADRVDRVLSHSGRLYFPFHEAAFSVWEGPGTSLHEAQGLNVDWSRGVVEPPKGLPIYAVEFVTTRRDHRTYLVRYVIDPSTNQGYVYTGKADRGYQDNIGLIYHGIEGNWFHAWSEWQKFADPLIAKARTH